MTDLIWVALIAAFPPTLAVLFSRREAKRDAKIADAKIDHVTKLTNSTATEQREEISALRAEVSKLRDHVTRGMPKGQTSQDVVPDRAERREDERRETLPEPVPAREKKKKR